MTAPDRRAAFAAGLRSLADLIEAHPDLPLPYYGQNGLPLPLYVHTLEQAVVARRVLAPDTTPDIDARSPYYATRFFGALHGLSVAVHVSDRVAFVPPVPEPEGPQLVPALTEPVGGVQ